jgi:hypothetical protein
VKKRTYKQWVEFHLKKLKAQFPDRPEAVLKIMADDMARESIKSQGGPMPSDTAAPSVPRVGQGAGSISLQPPQIALTPTPTPTTTVVPPGGATYNERMVSRIKAAGAGATGPWTISYPTSQGAATWNEETKTWDRAGYLEWADLTAQLQTEDYLRLREVLKILGYSGESRNKEEIDRVLNLTFGNLFPVKSVDDLIEKLKKRALPGAGDGAGEQLPLRQISPVDRGSLISFARSIVEDELQLERLDPELENQIVDRWMKKAQRGVVTMPTKQVRNPRTGKLENVVETKRAFNQQEEGLKLADRLRTMFPEQYQLASGLDFGNLVKQIWAGGD